MSKKIALAVALAVTAFTGTAKAADILVDKVNNVGVTMVRVIGKIDLDDGAKFVATTSKIRSKNVLVMLDSPGGTVASGLIIGWTIKTKGWSTGVTNKDSCASACADIWLAGKLRLLGATSMIGMHSASDKDGARSDDANLIRIKYYMALGIKTPAIVAMLTPGPDGMMWLTPALAKSIGLSINIL
jgi:hypothetical protein